VASDFVTILERKPFRTRIERANASMEPSGDQAGDES
jgi:hypothetical protein